MMKPGLLTWNKPRSGVFPTANTYVPESQEAQAYDRYAYAYNNPLKYTDPSGHWVVETNKPEEEKRYHAYVSAAERAGDSYSGHLNEYYSICAAYYYAVAYELSDADIWTAQVHLTSFASSTRINGWNNATDAMSIAGDVAWGMAPNALVGFTVGVAGFIRGGSIIRQLEGGHPNAHAWSKHGPRSSNRFLRNTAKGSRVPQTKFTNGQEMASRALDVVAENLETITKLATSGQSGKISFDSGPVQYSGYAAQTAAPISGLSSSSRFVFWYDGIGSWGLYTAAPIP